MYLGYDEHGNIITKDPFGERGESIRPLLGSKELTHEEYMGALKRAHRQKVRAKQAAKQKAALAMKKAQRQIEQRNTAIKKAQQASEYMRKMKYAKSGKMYSGLGGVIGNGLTPHHVSGEELVSTFKSNYGLSGADFGRDTMDGWTPDTVKKAVNTVYEKMLQIEKSLKLQFDTLSALEKNNKKNTQQYKDLKAAYDKAYNEYQNKPVKLLTFTWPARRAMLIDFGMKLKAIIEKIDSKAAANMALMFAAPVVYEQQVKSGKIKAAFSGYGFGSEFDRDDSMGFVFLPFLAAAGWQGIAAAFAGGGAIYAIYNYATSSSGGMSELTRSIKAGEELALAAAKAGRFDLVEKFQEQRADQIKLQKKMEEESGVTGKALAASSNISKTALNLGLVALAGILIYKFGIPMLNKKAASFNAVPAGA